MLNKLFKKPQKTETKPAPSGNSDESGTSGKAGKKKPLLLIVDALLILAVVGTLTNTVIQQRNKAKLEANICHAPAKNYDLTLEHDDFSQKQLTVHLCDTITITNKDTQLYSLNFGAHENHIAYPGYTAETQAPDETIVIDAVEKGNFELHDHVRDLAVLELTVLPKE